MSLKSLVFSTAALSLAAAGGAHALTDYTLGTTPGSLNPEGTYGVDSTPIRLRTDGAWGNYAAPTGAPADFEIVNASATPGARFFYETYDFVAGKTYGIHVTAADNYSVSAPTIQVTVGGVQVGAVQSLDNGHYGTTYTNPALPGPWQSLTYNYTATSSGPQTLAFVDTNLQASGNDFSFDPSVSGVPEPATWALMLVGAAGMGGALRTRRRGLAATA
jgi:hypothetical protein